ncbi:Uu.00g034740.m01.CDS01 [Anthostomella pinea]|uniref:Uu.00g034740.m01.CDS01 n=1 Tax=Anthostomella pinea TaxID=933095 RepID=A0AAI8VA49_9PEZI|nr:Uu.00g034740.m01.CDS01 [Anthostomella pinea]
MFATVGSADDGSLWTAFLPTSIGRIVVSPTAGHAATLTGSSVTVDACLTEFAPPSPGSMSTIRGDLKVFSATASPADDRKLFLKTVLRRDILDGADFDTEWSEYDPTEKETIEACEAAVTLLHADIVRTFPPIGGVVNGAMVLSDGLLVDMTFDSLQKVMKPKGVGSSNLDDLFRTQPLDFFLMLSSLSAVVGMAAQANYAAANQVSIAQDLKLVLI